LIFLKLLRLLELAESLKFILVLGSLVASSLGLLTGLTEAILSSAAGSSLLSFGGSGRILRAASVTRSTTVTGGRREEAVDVDDVLQEAPLGGGIRLLTRGELREDGVLLVRLKFDEGLHSGVHCRVELKLLANLQKLGVDLINSLIG